jgi:hypothetical protein
MEKAQKRVKRTGIPPVICKNKIAIGIRPIDLFQSAERVGLKPATTLTNINRANKSWASLPISPRAHTQTLTFSGSWWDEKNLFE